ncbi:MAG: F0F1 ATP synthase subunit A [Terracidiphilus sp.]|jgi:F-type H+-transporting ATPase subunit a
MAQTLALTPIVEHLVGGPLLKLYHALGIAPPDAANDVASVSDAFKYELLVAAGLIAFFLIVRLTLSVEKPNPAQQIAEMIHEFTGTQAEQIIGHGYERFQAFVTCVGLFIVILNLLGLVPGVTTPTSLPQVPLGIAVLTFLYYNFHGLRVHGPIGYMKQFTGPMWQISWLLLPIEVISHLARMMSLTIRLYANMLASDLLTLIAFSFVPFVLPVFPLALHGLVALIQAYVFMVLSMIYLGMAVSHEH